MRSFRRLLRVLLLPPLALVIAAAPVLGSPPATAARPAPEVAGV